MDRSVLEDLQHLHLTIDEEEDIQISSMHSSDLIEECTLSLFGKLLTDRQQNQRAFKNTLRGAWKMGSDLRIVDVQIWGLPFENFSEDVGKDLGNSLGRYLETDKRMWLTKQARFLRIWVDIPLNKPLRRVGDWLRANSNQKTSADRPKFSYRWGSDDERSGCSSARSEQVTKNPSDSGSNPGARSKFQESFQTREAVEPKEPDKKEKAISQAAVFQESNRQSTIFKLPNSAYPPRDRDRTEASDNGAKDAASGVGLTTQTLCEAQEVTSSSKTTSEVPTPMKKPTPPPNITQPKGKGNLKRFAREKDSFHRATYRAFCVESTGMQGDEGLRDSLGSAEKAKPN
nr:hypothetical protein CFP56_42029 [Quercus suber]